MKFRTDRKWIDTRYFWLTVLFAFLPTQPLFAATEVAGGSDPSGQILRGTLVTPDEIFEGEAVIKGDRLNCIAINCDDPPGAAVYPIKVRPGAEQNSISEPTPEMIGEMWEEKGIPPGRDPSVTWYQQLSTKELWKHVSAPENRNTVLVTLKRPNLKRGYFKGVVLISEQEIEEARQYLLRIPDVIPWDEPSYEMEMPIMEDGRSYPAVILQILNVDSLGQLRKLPFVEEVEPLFVAQDGIGCSQNNYIPNPADGSISGNKIPWTFQHLGVVKAWDLFKVNNAIDRPGKNIRIGVVDTGVYQDEHQLVTLFGWSPVRNPAHHLTVVTGLWDDCGHGTRIAGLATAPLDTQNLYPAKIVGVAWGSDLTTVKYNSGVVALHGSRVELVRAIDIAVNDGARVVNLALGMPYWSKFVYDNIDRIYNSTETIFVSAAGTFVPSVVFPAAMPQVLAVTIVKSKDPANPQAGYELYGGLTPEGANGPEVDFAAVNGDGDIPTTGGGQNVVTIGGSSSGTAHLSGIVALVWSKQPSATRAQVIARLRHSGSLRLISGEETMPPGSSQKVGYGIPDAYIAAGGFRHASISGPSTVLPGSVYTLRVTTDGWLPLNYLWDGGPGNASVTFTAGRSGTANHSVIITNPIDGTSLTVKHAVMVGPTHKRILYSDPPIVRFPRYPFVGGSYDVKVAYGVTMPVGCAVLTALGQAVKYVNGMYQNIQPPLSFLSLAEMYGFYITRPGGVSPRDLAVDASVWHSGLNAVRVRIHYSISEPDGVDCNMPGSTSHGWYPGQP